MVRHLRSGERRGWNYFALTYRPLIRKLLEHYDAGSSAKAETIIAALRESLFREMEPMPERHFVAILRQEVLARLDVAPAEIEIDLETVAAALAPLTLVEKQAAWFEAMHYDASRAAAMLRVSAQTV